VVVKPLDWARDGRSILAALVDETARTTRLVLVPAEGGEPRAVVSGNRGELEDWARLSPDGRFVAGLRSEGGKSHVCVWASDGDQETRVTEPGARVSPGFWSPDGAYLVFTSDLMKTQDLWAVPMRDGRPRGTPLRIKQDLKLLTLADKTSVTLATFPEGTDVSGPAWSPDARGIAFSDTRRLQVLSPIDRTPRALVEAPAGSALGGTAWFSGIAWSPDGRLIAYLQREVAAKTGPRSGLWVVPAAGGTPRRAAVAPDSHPLLSDVTWHPSGTKIFATGGTGEGQVKAAYQHWVMEGFLPER